VYAATKRAINAATLGDLEDTLDRERISHSILLGSEDVAEGIRAIAERRQPRFGIDGVPTPRWAE
jgi:enoyl-CoA hydratase